MTTNNRFLGAPYPIRKDTHGYLHVQRGVQQIKSDLLILLLTNPGERVYDPRFGTPLRQLIFEQNDAVIVQQAKQMIINSINLYEPRITVTAIDVSSSIDPSLLDVNDPRQDIQNILSINISFFDPQNIQSVQNLQLEVPLGA